MNIRLLVALIAVAISPVAHGQSLTLTNLKGPVAKACKVTQAKSIAELWKQLAACNAAVPAPTPTPTPTPVTTPTVSPALTGLASVVSGIKIADFLQPSWGTGAVASPEEGGVEGAFRFSCTPSHLSYDDTLVFPGQPGKSHLHLWFGNTGANAFSTYASLRTTGESTCNNILNRSAYTVPAMMNGAGKVQLPSLINIYYKNIPTTSAHCKELGTACIGLPRGLRYLFGYNMANPANSTTPDNMWWNCDAPNLGGHFASLAGAAKNCPVGSLVGMVITGPGCWDGVHLDSADHRSHMAYSYYDENGIGRCPKGYPYVLPHFTIGVWYTRDATTPNWYLSSDRMPDAIPGTTMHADWFGAWEDDVQAAWESNCIEKMLSCAGGDLGNGTQMKNIGGFGLPAGALVDPPAR